MQIVKRPTKIASIGKLVRIYNITIKKMKFNLYLIKLQR